MDTQEMKLYTNGRNPLLKWQTRNTGDCTNLRLWACEIRLISLTHSPVRKDLAFSTHIGCCTPGTSRLIWQNIPILQEKKNPIPVVLSAWNLAQEQVPFIITFLFYYVYITGNRGTIKNSSSQIKRHKNKVLPFLYFSSPPPSLHSRYDDFSLG